MEGPGVGRKSGKVVKVSIHWGHWPLRVEVPLLQLSLQFSSGGEVQGSLERVPGSRGIAGGRTWGQLFTSWFGRVSVVSQPRRMCQVTIPRDKQRRPPCSGGLPPRGVQTTINWDASEDREWDGPAGGGREGL